MRLFVKHLFRCTKNRPLQPLLLFLTILLSYTLVVSMLTVTGTVDTEFDRLSSAHYGKSDFIVRLSGDSRTRFMLPEDAEQLLAGRATVVGVYELILSLPGAGGTVTAAATELDRVGEIFPLTFSSLLPLPKTEKERAVYITEEVAERHALSVGDRLPLTLFGQEAVYTVYGISPSPLLSGRDLLIDIRGAIRTLSASAPLLSAFGEDFAPGSALYISLHKGMTASEATALLRNSSLFEDKSIAEVGTLRAALLNRGAFTAAILICTVLSLLLSSALLYSCFYLLSNERKDENEAFASAGAPTRALILLQYAELLFYWILAAPCGILLSLPFSHAVTQLAGFRYAEPQLTPGAALLGAGLLLAVSLVAVSFFLTRGQRKEERKRRYALPILFSLTLLLFSLTLAVPGGAALPLGIAAVVTLLTLIFFAVPPLIRLAARGLARLRRLPPSVLYAVKNTASVRALQNTARLFAVLVALVITAFGIVAAEEGSLASSKHILRGDYIVLNATDRCSDEMQMLDGVASLDGVHLSSAMYSNELPLTLLAVENTGVLGEQFGLAVLPQGEEAYLSSVAAERLLLKVGDRFTVSLPDRTLTLTLAGRLDTALASLIVDGEHHGLSPTMLVVKAEDGAPGTLPSAIGAIAGREMASVLEVDLLMENETRSASILVSCTRILVLSLALLSLTGILDNLGASYRERRGEFALYRLAGVTPIGVRRMKLAELAFTLLSGVLLGILTSGLLLLLFRHMLIPIGFDLGAGLRIFLTGPR